MGGLRVKEASVRGYGFQVAGEAAEQEGPAVVHNVFGLEALRWLDAGMARRFGTGGV